MGDIPGLNDFGPPFPPEEYRERIRKVKAAMAERGIDALIVTSPPNITYLTGYDSLWYDQPVTTAVVLNLASDGVLFFDTHFHRELVQKSAYVAGEVIHHRGWAGRKEILGTLHDRGWLKGTVGIEKWSRSPGAPVQAKIEAGLQAADAKVVDASWLVDRVKLVKSALEVACVRRAAAIADAGMEAVRRELRPGLTEIEVQGIAHYAMSRLQGEEPAIRTTVRAGDRAPAHHGLPAKRKVQAGDIVQVDFCGSYNRYHADLGRSFSVGEPDRRWVTLLEKAAGSVEAVVAQAKPGDPMTRVQQIADEYIDSMGLRQHVWFVGGYDLGIAIPPDWVGHAFLGGDRYEQADFEVGTVTNFENILDALELGWPGGRGVSYIETLLMTENGLEILSEMERTLIVV